MVRTITRVCVLVLLLAVTCLLLACGSSTTATVETPNATPAVVSIQISPTSNALALGLGQTTQFTATVTGGSNTGVTWSVNGTAGGNSSVGTIDTDGVFTPPAPQTPQLGVAGVPAPGQVVTVTATSAADSTKSASATVVLVSPGQVSATQNPLVAQYSFNAPVPFSMVVQFGPTTSYGLQTWSRPGPAGGGTQNMLVAGMRPNTTYHMQAAIQLGGGLKYTDPDQTFTTGSLPAGIPTITTSTTPGMTPNPGVELLLLTGAQPNLLATDLSGNVIWYASGPAGNFGFPAQPLPDGNMLINWGPPPGVPEFSVLEEVDLAGNVVWQLPAAQLNQELAAAGYNITITNVHHAIADLPNGHLVVIADETQFLSGVTGYPGTTPVTGDVLIDLDQNHNPVWVWSSFANLDVNYHPLSFPDWTHCNGLVYSPTDGNLILSCRNISWVMKIQYENGTGDGAVLWKLGANGNFTLTNGGASDWFYNQHYPTVQSTNSAGNFNLGVWDNGNTRPDPVTGLPCQNAEGNPGGGSCFSRGVILNLNESAKTASIVWQDPLQEFSDCCGNLNVLGNGDVEMGEGLSNSSYPTGALEVTQTASPQLVWQLNVAEDFSYRIFRITSLYPGVTWNTLP